MKIVECVPNFSEGRDQNKIKAIAESLQSFPAVQLLDYSADTDHNRSVFTFLGEAQDILQAALAAAEKALDLIDMRKQEGVHPRLGAVDVVPFIPFQDATMEDAIRLARLFGRKINQRYGIPVYFYSKAALKPDRIALANIRRGGYESLPEKMTNPSNAPDLGGPQFDARWGATVVGARRPLVAYNINLQSGDLKLAQKLASQIREKNGGLKNVQAIGVHLKSRNLVQVSMNLTDCDTTPIKTVYELVETLAGKQDIEILESELIGLAPQSAFAGTTPERLKLKNFDAGRLLEMHLRQFARLDRPFRS